MIKYIFKSIKDMPQIAILNNILAQILSSKCILKYSKIFWKLISHFQNLVSKNNT